MNLVVLSGRLVRDCEVRYGGNTPVGRFTLAVDRKFKKDGEPTADFLSCVCFGSKATFMEKYGQKGVKFNVTGEIRTGSYEKDGRKIQTTDIVVNDVEFAESKANSQQTEPSKPTMNSDEFMSLPEGMDSKLPFV